MSISQRHSSPTHIAKSITSVSKLLGSKRFGNYGSVDTDLIIHSITMSYI